MREIKRKIRLFIKPLFLFIFISVISVVFFVRKVDSLPEEYKDYRIIEQKNLDRDPDGKLLVLEHSDQPISKIIFVRDSGFIELPGTGARFDWWQVGDFNKNQKLNVAAMYHSLGSGAYDPFYLYEWNGESFEIKLQNWDNANWDELVDLDKDGLLEVIHIWNITKWGPSRTEVFQWDQDKQEYVKANHIKD